MALSKKQAKQISKHINSLSCYKTMVNDYRHEKKYDDSLRAMHWYNEAADALIAMGIPVIKYSISE